MRILVCNLADEASRNIRDRLLEAGDWHRTGLAFRGHPVWDRRDARLVAVDGPVVTDESLCRDLRATGWGIEAVWFLSRHRAASGQPSLTVHPIGNPGEARFGGRPGMLCPAAPRDMGALLRRLRHHRDQHGLPHEVTYEATHHGPWMDLPSLFVEIGSDERYYDDRPSAEVLAAAVHDVLDGKGRIEAPVRVGVGGGHYVPRMDSQALAEEADFGHLLAGYAIDPDREDPGLLRAAWDATPGADEIYVHKKGLNGPQRQRVKAWREALGL